MLTREDFVISILPLELHLGAGVQVLNVVLVLGHPLEDAELHVKLSLASDFEKVLQRDSSLEVL